MGSAYLFEKPRSGAKNIPRFSDITSSDNHYCNDNANCDSSAYNTMKNQCQLDSNNDSGAGYTNNNRYKLNKSQKRRPRARGAMTLQSHVGSTKPIRKPKND